MANYGSVQKFAARAERELERVDILLANAGIASFKFARAEDNEKMITVNVVSTFLLTLLMMPKLKETAKKFNTRPVVTITSSEVHAFTNFPEKWAPPGQIFQTLNDKSKADMNIRYPTSKLLEIFGVCAFARSIPVFLLSSHPQYREPRAVPFVSIDTNRCIHLDTLTEYSSLVRDGGWALFFIKLLLARSTEYGSRTLVHAASQGLETHGQYLSDCKVAPPSALVLSDVGKETQDRVWDELMKKLEAIKPGVSSNF